MSDTAHLTQSTIADGAGPQQAAAAEVLDMITGGLVSQITRTIAMLHIPDHIAAGADTAETIASLEKSNVRTTFRLMRAAASIGLLRNDGNRRFSLTERGELLRSDTPGSLRATALALAGNATWQCWAHLPNSVVQGHSQVEKVLGADQFGYYARDENKEEAALFARAMGDLSSLVIEATTSILDTTDASMVVDVGGAGGDFVLGLLEANPSLSGKVFDLQYAMDGARHQVQKRGLSARVQAVAGDFFEAVPAADLYLLKMILHDWDDDHCVKILRNCRDSARPDGRAVIVEMVIGESNWPDFAARADMNMLSVHAGGTERDLTEYDSLFSASGWRRTGDAQPVGGGYYLLIAEAS